MSAAAGADAEPRRPLAHTLLMALPALVGAGFIALFVAVALQRIAFPYELEWMEGGIVDAARRVREGLPLYGPASLDYVPFIYPPLYFQVAAAFSVALGPGYLPLRLVSLLAALGCIALCYAFVRRDGGDRFSALTAAGLFAATYDLSGAWLDLGRIDSLMVVLLLASFYGLRSARGTAGHVAAGLALCAAFYTKQVALTMALPVMLYALIHGGRGGRIYVATAVLTGAGALFVTELATSGLFRYYVFAVPARHSLEWTRWSRMFVEDLGQPLPIACALALSSLVFALGELRERGRTGLRPGLLYACMLLGVLAGCWQSRLHFGGFRNVLIPAHALLAVGTGLALARAQRWSARSRTPRALALYVVLTGCVLGQLGLLWYDPSAHVPTAAHRSAVDRLHARMRALPGRVLVPYHGVLATRSGQPAHGHQMAITDLYRGGPREHLRFKRELERAIAERRFGAIVLDTPDWHGKMLADRYALAGPLLEPEAELGPASGLQTTPRWLFLPIAGRQ